MSTDPKSSSHALDASQLLRAHYMQQNRLRRATVGSGLCSCLCAAHREHPGKVLSLPKFHCTEMPQLGRLHSVSVAIDVTAYNSKTWWSRLHQGLNRRQYQPGAGWGRAAHTAATPVGMQGICLPRAKSSVEKHLLPHFILHLRTGNQISILSSFVKKKNKKNKPRTTSCDFPALTSVF